MENLDVVLEALDNVTEEEITDRSVYKDSECKVCFNGLIAQTALGNKDLTAYEIMCKLDRIYENIDYYEQDDYGDSEQFNNVTRDEIDQIHADWIDGEYDFQEAVTKVKEYLKNNEA